MYRPISPSEEKLYVEGNEYKIQYDEGNYKKIKLLRRRKYCSSEAAIMVLSVIIISAYFSWQWIHTYGNIFSDIVELIPGEIYHPEGYNGDLIKYSTSKDWSYKRWTNVMEKAMKEYNSTMLNEVGIGNFNETDRCAVNFQMFGPCSSIQQIQDSYSKGSPCVFVRLNRILDWKPIYYNNDTSLAKDMPEFIKMKIGSDQSKSNTLWLSCDGINPVDKEHIGPVHYFPESGFSENVINCTDKYKNLNPLVAVWFKSPQSGVFIHIECKIWAKNVHYNALDKGPKGTVKFGLMIDN
ncbi:hypothetical protein C0J52_19150 [Blattella germanica]|nr:hypothetical protein C0J52_19150 [Blattella germanica]